MSRTFKGVRDGTPLHGKSLCDTCSEAHIVKGAAESERQVVCEAVYYRPQIVPFRIVVECSSYFERNRLSLHQMNKTAYILQTDKRGRPVGFKPNDEFRKDTGMTQDDDVTPGAR